MLLPYYLCCCICAFSFGLFPVLPFSVRFLIYTMISLIFTPDSLATNSSVWHRTRGAWMGEGRMGGGGSHGWRGGVLGLVHVVTRARDLTCQPNPRFQIPVRIPVMQGTGSLISTDHMWVRSRNSDFNLSIYPPLYVKKGFVPFLCHGPTQLREYNQGFYPHHSIY